MSIYTCINCGYVFDEEKGSPAQRVAPNMNAMLQTGCGWHKGEAPTPVAVEPGTPWENVPQNYTCPSCGAAKNMFE